MNRSIVKIIVVLVILATLAGVAGVVGLQVYRKNQVAQWLADGDRHYEDGTYNLAKASYGLYLRNHPDDHEVLRRYADSCKFLLTDRRFTLSQAATAMHQSLRYTDLENPERPAIVLELINLYQKIQAWGDLLFFVDQELARDPESLELHLARAESLYRLGKFQDAEAEFAELCKREGAPGKAFGFLATLMYDRRLNTQAEAVLDDAIAARPGDAELLVERGRFRFSHGENELAMSDYDAALEADPNSVVAMVEKSIALAEQREFDAAAELAQRAIDIDPTYGQTYTVISHVLQRTGRMADAADVLQNMDVYVRVDKPTTMLALMEIQMSLDRIEDAKQTIEEYMTAYPTHHLVGEYFEGRLALVEERYDDAIKTLGVVYSEQPKFAPAQYFLISAYLANGEREEARTVLDQYMTNYPRDERAKALLAREFGRYLDMGGLLDVARGKLVDPLATPDDLVASGASIIGSAQQAQAKDETVALALELFREAIRRDPKSIEAYRATTDLYAAIDRFDKARETIESAVQAGIAKSDMAISEANIEVRAGNIDAAEAIMKADFAEAGESRYVEWALFFIGRAHYDVAQRAIDTGREVAPTAALELEQARLYTREGKLDEAGTQLAELDSGSLDPSEVNGVRIELVSRLLQQSNEASVEKAGTLVASVIESAPENLQARILNVQVMTRETPPDYEGARAYLAAITEDFPDAPQVRYALSGIAMEEGKLEEALELAKQLVIVAPAYTPGQIRVAEIHLKMGQLVEAEAALETALDAVPDIPELVAMLASVYLRAGQGRNAEGEMRKLESLVGNDPAWEGRLAALRNEYQTVAGEAREAEDALRARYEAEPDRLDLAAALADNLVRQTRTPDAIKLIQDWADSHPSESDGWIALARLYLIQRDQEGLWNASTALTRSLVVEPENTNALREMVDIQSRLGNYADAILLADRFLNIRPSDADMLFAKATFITRDRSRLAEAVEFISQAIALRDDPKFRGLRGYINLELGNYGAALEDLEVAAQARGVSSGQLDLALAEGYLGVAKFDLAHRYYDLAVEKAERGESLSPDRLDRVEGRLRTDE